jgi:hypothetical protein
MSDHWSGSPAVPDIKKVELFALPKQREHFKQTIVIKAYACGFVEKLLKKNIEADLIIW